MTQILHLPLWLRFEPVLRFDSEGLFALAVPCRSEAFAEDLLDEPDFHSSTSETRGCDDPRRGTADRAAESAA